MPGLVGEASKVVIQAGAWAAVLLLVLFGAYMLINKIIDRLNRIHTEAQQMALAREERLLKVIEKQTQAFENLSSCIDTLGKETTRQHHEQDTTNTQQHQTILNSVNLAASRP